MGWFRRKWTDDDVRAEIDKAVQAAVSATREELERKGRSDSTLAMAEAVGKLYTTQIESFGKTAGILGEITQGLGDLTVRKYASLLGSRGGRKKQANIEARRVTSRQSNLFDPGCQACIEGSDCKNLSAIAKHVLEQHDARRRQAAAAEHQPAQPQPAPQPAPATNGSAPANTVMN